jgi:hypothetical protein
MINLLTVIDHMNKQFYDGGVSTWMGCIYD